ncbi:MAG: hypothetical protein QOJ91_1884 [Sphingomonadales bacterium]|jgi:hypothetical protein|nr:hypothetical protein [Sphingomonadales bacterium]
MRDIVNFMNFTVAAGGIGKPSADLGAGWIRRWRNGNE